jgi:hypothetical protein
MTGRIEESLTMKPRSIAPIVAAAVVALGLGYAVRAARADGIPATSALSYAGVLEDPTGPVNGPHNIGVSLYDAASGGHLLCEAASAEVTVVAGHFGVPLPDDCTASVGANPDVWLDVFVDGSDTGRTKIGAVPYAAEAAHAVEASHAATADQATGALQQAVTTLQQQVASLQAAPAPLVHADKIDAVPGDPWYSNCNSSSGAAASACALMAHYTCVKHGYKSGWFEGDTLNGHWGIVCVE